MRTHFGNEAREEEFLACRFVVCAAAAGGVRLGEVRCFVAVCCWSCVLDFGFFGRFL
jgi:hypothetical protein